MKKSDFSEIIRVGIVITILLFLLGIFVFLRMKSDQRWAGINDKNGTTPTGTVTTPASENTFNTTMFFKPEKKSAAVGEEIDMAIFFQADKKVISGADAVIFYDPETLELISIETGDYFMLYPKKKADPDKKVIKITGYQSKDNKALPGVQRFATLKLKAKKKGLSQLSFDFKIGTTNRTTLVEKGTSRNLLGKVMGAEIEVK